MNFRHSSSISFVPDGLALAEALPRTTHLGIGAHHDDLEFMAYHGILSCFQRPDKWFTGVTCTDGKGSSRVGAYEKISDAELAGIRIKEQNTAAIIGQFGAVIQLGYASAEVSDPGEQRVIRDLAGILRATRPEIVYTHNPADKHRTHIGVFASVLAAIRSLPQSERPAILWGCEAWRSLDWLADNEKVFMDVSGKNNLAASLNGVFDSQISGGKRYDLAVMGRRAANATLADPHSPDDTDSVILGMNLTPLIEDDTLDPLAFTIGHIDRFTDEVRSALSVHFTR
jgi:LmbE family N-acetylglucosaminyl deacetylase